MSAPPSPSPPSDGAASSAAASAAAPSLIVDSVPSLPSRNYIINTPSSYALPQTPPPLVYAPNTVVPKFIRIVAMVVFLIGGTCSAGVAWVYKTLIYPRLVLTLNALTQLQRGHAMLYSRLLKDICALALMPANLLISRTSTKLAKEILKREEAEAKQQAQVAANKGLETKADDLAIAALPAFIPVVLESNVSSIDEDNSPPSILEPLQLAIESLASSINSAAPRVPPTLSSQPKWSSALGVTLAERDLTESLSSLTEYIETELFASTSAAYRAYGSSTSAASKETKTIYDAVSNFKTEVRSIKGALLNRRNFASVRIAA